MEIYKTNTGSPIMVRKANLSGDPQPEPSTTSSGGSFLDNFSNVLGGLTKVTNTASTAYNDLSGIFGWTKTEGSPILTSNYGCSTTSPEEKKNYTPLIIGGIVSALLIGILLFVILRKKK